MQRGSGRLFLFFFLSAFLTISLASAACIDSNDIILRLSSATNAHGEVSTGTAYTQNDVCYSTLFGGAYVGTNPHVCTGTNKVVGLSSATNAHAQNPALTTYTTNVCYGNLVCAYKTTCGAGETEVVSLSNANNAHLEVASGTNYIGHICCNVGGTTSPGNHLIDTEWRDYSGNKIGKSVNVMSYANRTVQAIAKTGYPAGTTIYFELWEDDPLSNNDNPANYTALTDSSGTAVANIKFNDTIATGSYELGELSDGQYEFYFLAKNSKQLNAEVNKSETLNVNQSAGPNTAPVANITAPVHRGIYFAGTSVEFKQNSFDFDGGALSSLWTIDEDKYSSALISFNYTFASPGMKTITLKVTDDKGASNEQQIAVLVVASPGILAFINRPVHKQAIINESKKVILSANDSYVVDSEGSCTSLDVLAPTSGDIVVKCLAGVCPTQTQNSPCGAGSIQVESTPQGWNKINFDWAFSDGDPGANADGLGNYQVSKEFAVASSSGTDYKSASLTLNYTDKTLSIFSLMASTNRKFSLQTQCIEKGEKWVEQYDLGTGAIVKSFNTRSSAYCVGPDGNSNTADDCCPLDANNCTVGGCRQTNESICNDVKSKNSCMNSILWQNPNNPGYNDVPKCGDIVNGSIVKCSCAWYNDSITTGSYCGLNKSTKPSTTCTNPPCTKDVCKPAVCNYLPTTPPTECVNGYAEVNVQAEYIQGTCGGDITEQQCLAGTGPRTILCGKPSIALSFFGIKQFIGALLIILVIYFFMGSRKRK